MGLVEPKMLFILLLSITVQQAVCTSVCGGFPRAPANSDLKCFSISCMATCRGDHRFENGLRMLALTCRNNTWLPWYGGFNYIPDCLAPCRPSCANGTLCRLPQKQCHCPDGFGGPSCQTAMTCPEKEVHRGCADSCNATCRARALGEPCKVNCVEGCTCSAGMARTDKGKCVTMENCPCYVDGVEIEDGFQSMNRTGHGYDVCTCSNQQWTCKPLAKGRAAVFGEEGNLAMFDGTITKYQAYCGFYLIKDPYFDISIDGRPTTSGSGSQNNNDSPSRFRSLTINISRMKVQLLQNRRVIVNYNWHTLPYEQSGLKIWEASSKYLIAYLPNGIEIHWDGETVANVFVPPSLYKETKGILGAYNGKKNNPLLTRNGEYTNSMTTFLDSWRVDNCSLPVMRARTNVACSLESVPDEVHQMCSRIFDPSFSECIEMMELNNTENYYVACVTEACKSNSGACRVISEYANMCSNLFALNMTSWIQSVPECVPKCPAGQFYQFCRSSCSRSCYSHAINPNCETECVEGCNCPEGQSLDIQGKCIPTTDCFCMHEDRRYEKDSIVVMNSDLCTCKDSKWECIRESYGYCYATGDPSYKTFDGRKFLFQGLCSYTLVQNEKFMIEAANQPSGSGATTANVTIRYEGWNIQLLQSNKVTVDNESISLPLEIKGVISLYMSTSYLITAKLANKVIMTWDGMTSINIYLPVTFFNTVKGLCGTFNNNSDDDFEMRSGNYTNDENEFGNSWVLDPRCPPIPPHPHPCTKSVRLADLAQKMCSKIQNSAFKPCHDRINYTMTYESCRFDVCALDNSSSACPHFKTYAEECKNVGILLDWRNNITECGTTCPSGQVYKACGNACSRSCSSIQWNPTCQSDCVEDCYCPEGKTLDDRGFCVDIRTCPCVHDGIHYNGDEQITRNDSDGVPERCTCKSGRWKCTAIPDATCTIFGDPHYITFDGVQYDFQGNCTYYLVWHHHFTIEATNMPWERNPRTTMTKSLLIKTLDQEIEMLQNRNILINGVAITSLPATVNGFEIRMASGSYVEVTLFNNVKILWSGKHLAYITIPGSLLLETEGLCGTYNFNTTDDFYTRTGVYVNSSSINRFGDSWQSIDCNQTPDIEDPCELNPAIRDTFANETCSHLLGATFKVCHNVVPVKHYYNNCKYDLCAGGGNIDSCASLVTYATECANKNVTIDWRTNSAFNSCEIACNSGQVYKTCGDSCTLTCKDLSRDFPCNTRCVEGCQCPEGSLLNSNNVCVPAYECPCTYQEREYRNGKNLIKTELSNDKIEICTCVAGMWTCKEQGGARCSVIRSKHYTTFDNTIFDFPSTHQKYILLWSNSTIIEIIFSKCFTQDGLRIPTCTKNGLKIKSGLFNLELSQYLISLNGMSITHYPFQLKGIFIKRIQNHRVSYIVTLPDGIEIIWDAYLFEKIYIDIPANLYGTTIKGLCGNFNNNASDDFTLRKGNATNGVYHFGNIWGANDEIYDVTMPSSHPCSNNETHKIFATNVCQLLLQEKYSACHSFVDVNKFIEYCKYDICECASRTVNYDLCDISICGIEDIYRDACAQKGVYINREPIVPSCRTTYCPVEQEYHVCKDVCSRTCHDIQHFPSCKCKCVPGCHCPLGKTFNSAGDCVDLEECQCLHNDNYFKQGDKIIKENGNRFEYCHCGEGRWRCQEVSEGMCSALNNQHFTTFSGLNVDVDPGYSYYLLAHEDFKIITLPWSCYSLQNGTQACSSRLVVEYGSHITLEVNPIYVTYNNKIKNWPLSEDGIIAHIASTKFFRVQLPNGVNIQMDVNVNRIYVKVPPNMFAQTQGLCGSSEERKELELQTRWGSPAITVSEFANSWRVSQLCETETRVVNYCNETNEDKLFQKTKCNSLKTVLGKACSSVVDVNRYYTYCKQIGCNKTDVCNVYEAYAEACASKGIVIDWRVKEPTCEMKCEKNTVYNRCPKSRPLSCFEVANPYTRNGTCLEGCTCPEGFVYDDNQNCVNISVCMCIKDGKSHLAGSFITQRSGNNLEKCQCRMGQWKCKSIDGARCSSIGVPQHITFDGGRHTFATNCSYYLVRTPKFSVEVQHFYCNPVEVTTQSSNTSLSTQIPPKNNLKCNKKVTVRTGVLKLEMIMGSGSVESIWTPYWDSTIMANIHGVFVRQLHFPRTHIIVTLPNGAEVWLNDLQTVHVDVPSIYFDQTEGICGKFNHESADDMTTTTKNNTTALIEFVKSWQVDSNCYISVPNQCESPLCNVLRGPKFSACHAVINVEGYYEACSIDMCNSDTSISRGCAAVIDYAQRCADKGILVDWRSDLPQCIPKCRWRHQHLLCMDSCFRTEYNFNPNFTCKSKCLTGCGCDSGYIIGHLICIPKSQFGCRINRQLYKPGSISMHPILDTSPAKFETCICDGSRWDCEEFESNDFEIAVENGKHDFDNTLV